MNSPDFLLTKIIATLGPATSSVETITQLIYNGVRVFRINFSHGAFKEYAKLIRNIRKAEKQTGKYIAIMGDLSGPKIRLGKVIDGGLHLLIGQKFIFVKENIVSGSPGYENILSTTFPSFINDINNGERILLDDGNAELKLLKKNGTGKKAELICEVVRGGLITSAKGINLPDTQLSVEALTTKDKLCAEFAVEKKLDYLALSFVRQADDIRQLKTLLVKLGARPKHEDQFADRPGMVFPPVSNLEFIPIITKIEKPQAIQNLEEIVKETDSVMVARGDLGVEMDLADVALLQKKIIHLCQEYGKPVIVATQMLESMIHAPVPTRAEVSDVANAIFDGADAVMLSGETAVGKYPVKAVGMMNKIALRTNAYIKQHSIYPGVAILKPELSLRNAAIATAVKEVSRDVKPVFLVVWTNWGGSALYLSQQRLPIPLLAFTADKKRLRMLNLLYGVESVYMRQPSSGSKFIKAIDELLISKGWAKEKDPIIVVSGDPIRRIGLANRVVIHYVGESVD
ncbi:MAG: pyruvate kinase [Bacteroidales bacterium]